MLPEEVIVMLFSVGLQEIDGKNLNEVKKEGNLYYGEVQNIILNTSSKQRRYLYLLNAINAMVLSDTKAADYFMERVFSEVKNEIGITFNEYKKDFGLSS